MSNYKVVLLEDRYASHGYERRVLEAIGAEVIEGAGASSPGEVLALCGDADAILVNLAPLSAETILGLTRCKVIARYGVGFDNVDIQAAARKGIFVLNVPDYCLEDVSDQAFALLMACVRKTSLRDRQVRSGQWNIGTKDPMFRIAGKVFGLAGYGSIPKVLHRKLKGFDLKRVLVYDPFVTEEVIRQAGGEKVDFGDLLSQSDFVSCHVPLGEKTRHLFNAEAFANMKPGAIFINTSRGGLVDTQALYEALKSGHLNSAGLDVHETEPVPPNYSLFGLDNVVLSDHTGWYSEEAQVDLQTKAAQGVADVLTGKPARNAVNKP
jgi:D-3-phosphoglycerate dehydrogenase